MKTEIDRLAAIWQLLAFDTTLSQYVTDADLAQFKRRVAAEGLTFLTVTLPALGKALDLAFRVGQFVLPEGWGSALNAAYPAFLHKAWDVLLDKEGKGRWVVPGEPYNSTYARCMKDEQDLAVLCIRQLTMVFYKYEQPWTEAQADSTYAAFQATEEELWATTESLLSGGLTTKLVDGRSVSIYLARAERLIARLLDGIDPSQVKPRYGTGATADQQTPWGRWENPRFIGKLDKEFPYNEYFYSGINGLEAALSGSKLEIQEESSPCARVVLVPKDSRGPRLISAEPSEFMYIQQGLMKLFVDAVEQYQGVRAQVSIIDQSRNQCLALIGSQTNHLATLDLKEASDRVSWWLVTRLFPETWVEALNSCRSEQTVMPNGDEIPLTKFAPMGSACCFPVESLVFWALCNAARDDYDEGRLFRTLFRHSPNEYSISSCPMVNGQLNELSVFGDDLIVRVEDATRTIELLESVGLKVNVLKSYANGPFRESCGGDYYLGYNVTPLRVKRSLRGDQVEVVYNFCVLCNSVAQRYGQTDPKFVYKLRELTNGFFGLKPAIVSSDARTGVHQCYVLTDLYWGSNEPGQTPKPVDETWRYNPRTRAWEEGPDWTVRKVRSRCKEPNPVKPDYGYRQLNTLTAQAVEAERDLGWCSVLRSFCIGSEQSSASTYTFRKRVCHKLAWYTV